MKLKVFIIMVFSSNIYFLWLYRKVLMPINFKTKIFAFYDYIRNVLMLHFILIKDNKWAFIGTTWIIWKYLSNQENIHHSR